MENIALPNGIGMGQLGSSRNTKCELAVRSWLRSFGFRVYANRRGLPGSPDAVVYPLRLCVFADGDFWHRPERMAAMHKPHHKINWTLKGKRGKRREYRSNKRLRELGWRVVRVWGSSISKYPEKTKSRLFGLLYTDFSRTIRL